MGQYRPIVIRRRRCIIDPSACLERIRKAYGTNDFAEVRYATEDLLAWIRGGGFLPAVSEPQLSALLIMALSYGETAITRQAPEGGAYDVR